MATIPDVRERIQFTLEQYFRLEAELKQLEKDRFRVCIFGSARMRPEDPVYDTVREMARMLAELSIDVVTGGGPGLMEAANRGLKEVTHGQGVSYGLTIALPRSQELANRHLDIKSEHKRFSSRLDEFMRLSHAVIVAPGGVGTLLELTYVWQLIQVGMIERRPVVLLGRKFWDGLIEWMQVQLLGNRLVSPGDFDWVHSVDRPEEALEFIQPELERFQAAMAGKAEGAERAAEAARMLEQMEERRTRWGDPGLVQAPHTS